MPYIKIGDNDSFENALRKFKKQCEREGILSEIRKESITISPGKKKKKQLRRKL
jgi:small subunit ribosomal protein S21